jgi:hypothetical protein
LRLRRAGLRHQIEFAEARMLDRAPDEIATLKAAQALAAPVPPWSRRVVKNGSDA